MIDFHDLSACFCDFHPGMDEFSLSILYNYPCISARKNRFSQNPWSILSVVFSASVIISWFIVKAASTWEDLLKRWAPTARATTPWASEYATLAAYPRLASQRIPAPPEQKAALKALIEQLKEEYPEATVHGHNEFAAKDCPCFDVKEEFGE